MSPALIELLNSIVQFIKRLPSLMVAFGIGKKIGENNLNKAKIEALDAKIEMDKKQNELDVEKKYSGLSDSDVIDSAIEAGSKMPGRNGTEKP